MSRIALLRHGPTAWNAAGKIQGSIDIPLSPEGLAHYRHLRLPDELAAPRVFCSPRLRARQTAAALGFENAIPDVRLEEQNWGRWEGQTLAEITLREGKDAFLKAGRKAGFRPPGGESIGEVQQRVGAFFHAVAEGDDAVAVTHKGVLRAAYVLATGWDGLEPMPPELDTGKILVLELDADGAPKIAALNRDFKPAG